MSARLASWLVLLAAGLAAGPAGLAAEPATPAADLPVPALPWYRVKAPPLPAPAGKTVEVRTAAELLAACRAPEEGSTILLADGTYELTGRIYLRDCRNVTLRGKSGDRAKAVIDGAKLDKGELVTVAGGEGVTIADLTVQNAAVHGLTFKGEANTQRPRVYNCRLRNCWERYVKGTAPFNRERKMASEPDPEALRVRPAGGRIEYCLFEQDGKKTADDWTGGDYIGGIDMMWLKDWTVSDNVFLGIRGKKDAGRGAIFIWNNSEDVVVERNLIVGCDAGICLGNPSGAAVHMTRGIVRNNFVVRGAGKAVELVRTKDCLVYNNTVWSGEAGWDRTFHLFDGLAGAQVFNNLVRGKLRVDGQEAKQVEVNLAGELDGFFADPAKGDLHLTAKGAEAVRGRGLPVPEGTRDFYGKPRPAKPALGAVEP